MTQKLVIIKIGGNVLNSPGQLEQVLESFSKLDSAKILVHGGGRKADQLCTSLGIVPQMIGGRRITDAATLEVVTMVYAGLINKSIVAALQAKGCNAIGLTGADANSVQGHKRPVGDIDYGFAGDIEIPNLDSSSLRLFLDNDLTPVLCSITHDRKGQLLNTNADTIASVLSSVLAKYYQVRLIYCFEKDGVLADPENDESVIGRIDQKEYQRFQKSGVISHGMIPKMDNAFDALNNGVEKVTICGPKALVNQKMNGTEVCLTQE